MSELEQLMSGLGYTQAWLDAGVVDEEYVRRQFSEFAESDDKHQEHYRARAFSEFMERCAHITDQQVDDLLALTDEGPDKDDLRDLRVFEVLKSGVLSDLQFDALSDRYPEVLEPPFRRRYVRERFLRKFAADGWSDNLFEEMKLLSDSHVERIVLECSSITREQISWLQEFGTSKAIRNIASQVRLRLERRSGR